MRDKGHSGSRRNDNKELTEKQKELFPYIAQGLTSKEIAKALNISESSVESRIIHIMDLTGCITREELTKHIRKQQKKTLE